MPSLLVEGRTEKSEQFCSDTRQPALQGYRPTGTDRTETRKVLGCFVKHLSGLLLIIVYAPPHAFGVLRFSISETHLLFIDSGLGFCATNLRNERLSCGWDWHFAQQQSPGCDVASIERTP